MGIICLYVLIQKSGQKQLNPTSVQCIAHVLADHRLTVQELGIGVQRGILGHEVA